MHWLTMEQALADYALVIKNVKEKVYNTGTSVQYCQHASNYLINVTGRLSDIVLYTTVGVILCNPSRVVY